MKKVLCLVYHSISDRENDFYNLIVSPDEFEKQIAYLKNNYKILKFEEDWSKCEGEEGVVITLDDGYEDNYLNALPILEKYDVPATVFVTTGNMDTNKEYWWEELRRLLTMKQEYPREFELCDSLYHYTWDTSTAEKRLKLMWVLLMLMEKEEMSKIEDWLQQLRSWCGVESENVEEGQKILSTEQLRKLAASKCITIGGHTVNHVCLSDKAKEEQEYEIIGGINDLEGKTGMKIDTFSIPYGGRQTYNDDTKDIFKKAGLSKVRSTEPFVWKEGMDEFLVPSFCVGSQESNDFEAFIKNHMEDK